jgi:hypothetical protein
MKNSLIKIKIGDKVLYRGYNELYPVTIKDFVVTPNGNFNPELVCMIFAVKENGNIISATSNNFIPFGNGEIEYEEFYPSVHLNNL